MDQTLEANLKVQHDQSSAVFREKPSDKKSGIHYSYWSRDVSLVHMFCSVQRCGTAAFEYHIEYTVGKTIINHPFGNGFYRLFMVIWGMLYYCFTVFYKCTEQPFAFRAAVLREQASLAWADLILDAR